VIIRDHFVIIRDYLTGAPYNRLQWGCAGKRTHSSPQEVRDSDKIMEGVSYSPGESARAQPQPKGKRFVLETITRRYIHRSPNARGSNPIVRHRR